MTEQESRDIQKQIWAESQKIQCRQMSLDYASKLGSHTTGSLLKDAQEIYEWLIKELQNG